MSEEWNTAGTGAATGAASGAVAGSMFGPVGTVVGGVAGGVAGGASGYLSGMGAAKRRRAQEEARARYEQALRVYSQDRNTAELGRREDISALGNDAQANTQRRLTNMPGDQTATLNQDYGNQLAAMKPSGPVGTPVESPLANTYQAEGDARVQTALAPIARGYAAEQQDERALGNEREYQLAQAALQPRATNQDQMYGLTQAEYRAVVEKAAADYGVQSSQANKAGSEHMLYGAMIQQGQNLGAQGAGAYGRSRPRAPQSALQPTANMDSWDSRVPYYNPNASVQA